MFINATKCTMLIVKVKSDVMRFLSNVQSYEKFTTQQLVFHANCIIYIVLQ